VLFMNNAELANSAPVVDAVTHVHRGTVSIAVAS
jgi:hypothetical protein